MEENKKPSKAELLKIMDEMIGTIEKMPPMGMSVNITHYDWLTLLYWLREMHEPVKRKKKD